MWSVTLRQTSNTNLFEAYLSYSLTNPLHNDNGSFCMKDQKNNHCYYSTTPWFLYLPSIEKKMPASVYIAKLWLTIFEIALIIGNHRDALCSVCVVSVPGVVIYTFAILISVTSVVIIILTWTVLLHIPVAALASRHTTPSSSRCKSPWGRTPSVLPSTDHGNSLDCAGAETEHATNLRFTIIMIVVVRLKAISQVSIASPWLWRNWSW